MLTINAIIARDQKNLARELNINLSANKIYGWAGLANDGREIIVSAISGVNKNWRAQITFDNEKPIVINNAKNARRQHLFALVNSSQIINEFTVWENLILPFSKSYRWLKKNILPIAEKFWRELTNDELPLNKLARDLSITEKRFIECARIAAQNPRLIVLHNALNAFNETQKKNVLKFLCAHAPILLVDNDPDNFAFVDDYALFNHNTQKLSAGEKFTDGERAKLSALIAEKLPPRSSLKIGKTILEMLGVQGGKISDATLTLRQGEICGITNLSGGGIDDFVKLLTREKRAKQGLLTLSGKNLRLRTATKKSLTRAGLAICTPKTTLAQLQKMFAQPQIHVYVIAQLAISGYDERSQLVRENFAAILAAGKSLIIVSENFYELQRCCHTIIVCQNGKFSPSRSAEQWTRAELAQPLKINGKISLL